MTPQEIQAVQASFARIEPQAGAFAAAFYTRLFEIDPTLRRLFKADLTEQGEKLVAVLAVAVNGLSRIEALLPALEGLGARHATHGVKDHHYDSVAQALLDTLSVELGEAFAAPVRQAWGRAYGLVAAAMQSGARLPALNA